MGISELYPLVKHQGTVWAKHSKSCYDSGSDGVLWMVLAFNGKSYRGVCQKFCGAKCADLVRVKLLAGQKAQ